MSFTFANLPGVQVSTVDGGLAAVNTPTTQSVLVLGTSAIGPANSPFQVVSLATAASTFGLAGTLTRGMAEAAAYCDNIFLMRVGTTQGKFQCGIQTMSSADTTITSGDVSTGTAVGLIATFTLSISLPATLVPGASITVSGVTTNTAWNATATVLTIDPGAMSFTAQYPTGTASLTSPTPVFTTAAIQVNATSANPGFSVILGEVAASASSDYTVWYENGILSLWLDGNLVYSNDPAFNVNTGDSIVSGAAVGGLVLNNGVAGNPDTYANSITLAVAAALSTEAPNSAPIYTAPQTGIGLTSRQLYIAQQNAMNILQGFPVDIVVTPGALADNPNVAFYVSATPATAVNNPATNPNALDWLWTGVDVNGEPIYQWADDAHFYQFDNSVVSTATLLGQSGATTPVATVFTSPSVRLAAGAGSSNLQPSGFHEVNFAYQLARFCAAQSEAPQADVGGCFGFIGCNGPANLANFSLPAVRAWIGFLPTYDPVKGNTIPPVTPGSGLLGIPFLVGATAGQLNDAAADSSTGRVPGLFTSVSGEYDGGPEIDKNGYPVQAGAYLAVQGDYCLLSNGYGTYVGNIAGTIAGLVSSLDQKRAVTNKAVAGVAQLYRASLNQLESLTFADIDMLRFTGQGNLPVALHDKTAATEVSDYTLTLRQRIKFLVIQTLLTEAQNYIGNSTNDGLALTALKTALDSDCLNLQKRGYLQSYNFTITSTASQQKVGQASIQISFVPANELVQLDATVGINLGA